jgi:outer membrane protein assembly factor BamB
MVTFVFNGTVYIGTTLGLNGNLFALNSSSGEEIWNYTTSGYITSCPCATTEIVYVTAQDGYVYALNASSGMLVWKFLTSNEKPWIDSSPS